MTLCHSTGNGSYRVIEVNGNAESAHRAHGDGTFGERVPASPSKVFNNSCEPVDIGIAVEKATNGEDADEAPGPALTSGDPVVWTYVVANTGGVTLSAVTVVDDQGVVVSCPGSDLGIGGTFTCTGSGSATEEQYRNVGTVTGQSVAGVLVTDSDASHYQTRGVAEVPSIDIEKATNGSDADNAPGPTINVGQSVTWTYVVTNTGNVTLQSISVSDDQGVAVSCPAQFLAAGASMTCSGSGVAVEGQYANVGRAQGTSPGGFVVADSDASHYHNDTPTGTPGISIEKATNGSDADTRPGPTIEVGSTVTWTYIVTNTGSTSLGNIEVTDDREVGVSCPGSSLNPGDSMTCTATGTAREGQYENLGTATGRAPSGRSVSDSDLSHYLGESTQENPSLLLDKRTNGQTGEDTDEGVILTVGSAVEWSYIISNTGNVALSGISVSDDQGVTVTCPKASLQPNEAMTCTGSGTAILGPYTNVGTAQGTSPGGTTVSANGSASYTGVN